MKDDTMKERLLLLVFIISLAFLAPAALALTMDGAAVAPESPVWLDGVNSAIVNFSVNCENNTERPRVYLTAPDNTITSLFLDYAGARYAGQYPASQTGTYYANFTCKENSTIMSGIIPFELKKLSLDIISPAKENPPTVYPLGYMVAEDGNAIHVSLKINGVSVSYESSPAFTVRLVDSGNNRYAVDLYGIPKYDPGLNEWILEAHIANKDIPAGLYSLEVRAKYTDDKGLDHVVTDMQLNSVRINQALLAVLQSPSPGSRITLTSPKEQELKVQVQEKGANLPDLGADAFSVYLEGNGIKKELPVNYITYDSGSGYYSLKVMLPEMSKKEHSYNLYAEVQYGNYKLAITRSITVDYVISLSGRLADPSGNIYTSKNTVIKLTNSNTEQTIAIDSLGEYDEPVKSGTYDVKMAFPQILRADVESVRISSSATNPVRYDQFNGNTGISGISVARLVVIEFGLPFDSAYLQVPYNDALIKNETRIEVYGCVDWNFGRRECGSGWEIIPAQADIVANFVEFRTDYLSAFAVGEKMGLLFEGSLDKAEVYAGDPVTLTSKVIDAKGNGIDGASVSYTVEGTKITGKVTTSPSGEFTLIINTPIETGKFNVKVAAEKAPFSKFEKTYVVATEKKKSVSFIVPETVDVVLDREKKIQMTVFNTGQVDLTNVKFDVVGLKTTWHSVIPAIIETIKVGEKKTVDLLVNIPQYDCAEEGCKKYYFVDITLSSDQIHEEASFTAKIRANETQNEAGIAAQQAANYPGMPDITGLFAATPAQANTTNMYLVVFFVIMAFALITIKKKKRGSMRSDGSRGRSGVSSVLGSIRREIGRTR